MIDANDAGPGSKIMINGQLYNVLERHHHKPGKGGAIVRFKLKGMVSGKVIEHTVKAGTRVEEADVSTSNYQYLYPEGDAYVFMDQKTYEQLSIDKEIIGFQSNFMAENAEVQITLHDGKPIGVELPAKLEFEVIDTIDDAAKGNTATNVTKEAKIGTGLIVNVPMFIKTGDMIRISTEDGKYVERVSK
jgi:elongation factor P